MAALHRVVRKSDNGIGWVVLDGDSRQVRVHTRTKAEAVAAATEDLRGRSGSGRLVVHFADGRIERDSTLAASHLVTPEALGLNDTRRTIQREGRHVDKALDGVLILLGIVGAPVSAWLNPSIQEAAESGWIALTFATFTWTVGCAGAVVVLRRSGLLGAPLVTAVSACYLGALAIASFIGHGVLEIDAHTGYGGFNWLATVVFSAVAAYGPLGVLLGAAVGTWLGFRLSIHVDQGFLS